MFEFKKRPQLEQCNIVNKTPVDKSGIVTARDDKWKILIHNVGLHMYE